MSPAPQGNPEVEKYIGSYLISQRIPPGAKASPVNKRFPNQQKGPETEKARNLNKYCYPPRDHARYPVPPMQAPVPAHYKHPGGWAGVPLISMTSGNPRRNKKTPSSPGNAPVHKFHPKHPQQNLAKGKEVEESRVESDRSPLTRLAIHTQGAPLIQAGRFNGSRCRSGYNRDQSRGYRGDYGRWDAAKESKTPAGVQNQNQACASVDSSSVASDESSGNSENSLPRIIKPRKRRKKDRKPLAGTTQSPSTPNESNQFPGEQDQNVGTDLKPFLPSRFENISLNLKHATKDLLSENSLVTLDDKNEDLIDTFTSDEFPFVNLLEDVEDQESEVTLCQCRYCDPSGVIWDVDQRCYSPFLTPPSPSTVNPLLRRSWSDPEPEPQRRCSSPSPLGLQVSSEIVTSPNGHRDIEIKFYSSGSGSGSGRSDRCIAVEE